MSSDENRPKTRAYLYIALIIFSAIFCFASLRPYHRKQYYPVTTALEDFHTESLILGIGVSIPIFIDVIVKTASAHQCDATMLFRWLLLMSLQIPDVILLSIKNESVDNPATSKYVDNLASFYVASAVFKLVSSIACIFGIVGAKSACLSGSKQYILLAVTSLIYVVLTVTGYGSPDSRSLMISGTAILFLMTFQVCILLVSSLWSWKISHRNLPEAGLAHDKGDNMTVCFCLILLLIRLISVESLMASCGPITEGYTIMTSRSVALDQYFQIAFMVGVLVVPWPLLEAFAFKLMRSTLSEKSAFTRYISHEVRAPLNVACLSLTFMKAEACVLRAFADSDQVSSMVEAISDVDSSCKTAISILNDILLFDKMKGIF